MPFLFMLIEQDMGQRCFAALNSRVVSFASICAGVTLFLTSSIAIYFGILASKCGLSVAIGESVLIEMVKMATNPTITAFFMVAIFVAVISTADSLLCSISSNLYCDFLTTSKSSSEKQISISRWLTLATGLLSFALTFLFDSVLAVLMLSYELSVSVLFVPVILAVLTKNPSRLGASVAMGSGALCFAVLFFFDPIVPREVLTQVVAFGGYFAAERFEQRALAVN
jgi:SSS family solute:Na+ symporter